MSDPNAEKTDKEVAEEQNTRVWNQWQSTDAAAIEAREAAEARAGEGIQTLPAYPEDEVLSVDEARHETKAQAEAQRMERKEENAAEREQRKTEHATEVEARKEAKKGKESA